MIDDVIHKLKDDNAVFFPAASEHDIEFASSLLSNNRFALIPDEYIEILTETNGFAWNGLEFYGTEPRERSEYDYTLPSIVDINTSFTRKEIIRDRLIIGAAASEVFLYDGRFKKFQVARRFNLDVETTHPTLEQALEPFIEMLL